MISLFRKTPLRRLYNLKTELKKDFPLTSIQTKEDQTKVQKDPIPVEMKGIGLSLSFLSLTTSNLIMYMNDVQHLFFFELRFSYLLLFLYSGVQMGLFISKEKYNSIILSVIPCLLGFYGSSIPSLPTQLLFLSFGFIMLSLGDMARGGKVGFPQWYFKFSIINSSIIIGSILMGFYIFQMINKKKIKIPTK